MGVAMTIGPIFLVNAVVVALFHWRYRRSYLRRLAARTSPFSGAYPMPAASGPTGVGAAEVKSSE